MLNPLRDKGLLWPTLFTLAGVAALSGLGTWQIQRKAWKDQLIQIIKVRSTAAPLPPEAWRELQCERSDRAGLRRSCDYTAVRLRGTFDHSGERHVFASNSRRQGGIGGPGFWIFTRFWLPDRKTWTLVNRGFVPHDLKDPAKRADGQLAGEVQIVGLIRTGEARRWFHGKNNERANIWYVRDPLELLNAAKTAARPGADRQATGGAPDTFAHYVDQVAPVPPGGLPLPVAATIALPNRHLDYAITWYGLAATLIVVYAASSWSRLNTAPFA
jgi:surfeit locus 1 family protein